MTKTIFHNIIEKKVPANILYEDKDVLIILDLYPVATGHSLVLPKKESRNFIDIDEDTMLLLIKKSRLFALQLIKKLNVEGFRLTTHCEKTAGQEIFYTHVHIIPSDSDFENRKNFPYLVEKLKISKL